MTSVLLTGSHDPLLVVLSLAIAIAASYTALDLAGRVRASAGWARGAWLATAALAMGGGIWAMHFVAMLAFRLPLPMAYAPGLTGLSLATAVLVTGLGFAVVGRRGGGQARDVGLGGLVMGGGIAAMHYLGMAAMRIPATPHYDGLLVVISVLIAVGAATVALWLARRDAQSPLVKLRAGVVMGLAIAGMHYTGMAAAAWAPHDGIPTDAAHPSHASLGHVSLALGVAAATLLVLVLALLAALFDRRFAVLAKLEAQAALAKSDARLQWALAELQAVYNTAPVGLGVLDAEMRWTRINTRLAEMNGLPAEAHLGRSVRELLPSVADAAEEALRRVLETGDPVLGIQIVGETPAQPGVTRVWEQNWVPLRGAEGRVVGVNVVADDVTERRRAEAALAESEARLRDLLATLDLGAAMVRAVDGTIEFWSEGCARLYGWSAAEAVGRDAHDLLRTVFPVPQAEMETALERDGVWTGDLRHLTRDGRELVVTAHKMLRRGADGRPVAVLESLTDVTAQRRAEAALAESEARFRAMVEQLGAGVALCDGQGRFAMVNDRFCDILGRSQEELLGGLRMQDVTHPDDLAANLPAFERSFDDGAPFTIEKRYLRPDGTVVWVNNSIAPVRDAEGRITAAVAVVQDVTARRAAETELARYRADLERLVEERTVALLRTTEERRRAEEAMRQSEKLAALGQLTGGVAHDFNNLLQVVASGTSLLRRSGQSDERRAAILNGMTQAVQKGHELTARLLAFARRQPLRPELVDAGARLANMSELLRQTLGTRLRVETDIAPDLWPVRADPGQFEVAVLNLAVNARDAMPEGGTLTIQARNVTLEAAAERAAGAYVCIAVRDTGMGIPPHILARVVEPFFTTKEPGKGTGLGLSQVHGFAKQSGGDLQIESEPGQGTVVFFHLPRAVAVAAAVGGGAAPSEDRRPLVLQGGGRTVLVVEDNPDVAAFACSLLEELGYATRCAGSAAEALAVLSEDGAPVDAVFSDVVMPGGMSGVDLAAALRASYPHLPVVLTTGYSEDFATRGLPGECETLGKPYHQEELAAVLGRALARRERSALEAAPR